MMKRSTRIAAAQALLDEATLAERAPEATGKPLGDFAVRYVPEELRRHHPPRRALLVDARTGENVFVAGKVGLLAGTGGSGKTFALLLLAVAVARGEDWFGGRTFRATRGRVLLVLAEEDREEVERRLASVCRALKLTDEQIAAVAAALLILPMAGQGVAFTHEDDGRSGALPETERPEQLRALLRDAFDEGAPFSLVVLDPLSRFAGGDVEKDAAAATRFVQVLESLTRPELGGPAVLIAHHMRKRNDSEDREASDLIRGSVGLHDGVRWAAVLAPQKDIAGAPDLLRLRVVKSNYAGVPEPLELTRDVEGTLRGATPDEVQAYQAAAGGPKRGPREDIGEAILAALEVRPGSGSELAGRLKRSKGATLAALHGLKADGEIIREGHVWRLSGAGSEPVPSVQNRLPLSVLAVPAPFRGGTRTGTDTAREEMGNG